MRSHIIYGLECWSLNKKKEIKVKITKIGMLRWIYGVTRNKYIRGSLGLTNIGGK